MKAGWIVALVGVLAVAAFIGLRGTESSSHAPREPAATPLTSAAVAPTETQQLPPGHPPIDSLGAGHPIKGNSAAGIPSGSNPPALEADKDVGLNWKVPARWHEAPNPSAMRIATYKIPKKGADSEDAEMSVMRAGGTTDANITRWVGQFDAASQGSAKRSTKQVHGLKVSIVEVQGTYAGGMMGAAEAKTNWALLGAVVETTGTSHFFKLTGPSATVLGARAEFDALIDGLASK